MEKASQIPFNTLIGTQFTFNIISVCVENTIPFGRSLGKATCREEQDYNIRFHVESKQRVREREREFKILLTTIKNK